MSEGYFQFRHFWKIETQICFQNSQVEIVTFLGYLSPPLFEHCQNFYRFLMTPPIRGNVSQFFPEKYHSPFQKLFNLVRHYKLVHYVNIGSEETFECIPCNKTFPRKDNYLRHKQNPSCRDNWQFTCKYCSKKFRSAKKLDDHILKFCTDITGYDLNIVKL